MKLYTTILIFLCVGCASPGEKLSREYENISRQEEALRKEQSIIVTLQFTARDYLKAKVAYDAKKKELDQLKEKHRSQGLPVSSNIESGLSLEEEIKLLNKYEDALSDEIRKLEKKKAEIIKEKAALKAK